MPERFLPGDSSQILPHLCLKQKLRERTLAFSLRLWHFRPLLIFKQNLFSNRKDQKTTVFKYVEISVVAQSMLVPTATNKNRKRSACVARIYLNVFRSRRRISKFLLLLVRSALSRALSLKEQFIKDRLGLERTLLLCTACQRSNAGIH